jgi:transcriptional regulator with XRE-family HTH domain
VNGMSDKTTERLRDKAYRDAYIEAHVKIGIPHQIRALREQEGRKWTQGELAKRSKKSRTVISRLEDPEYGRHTIRTLLELASAFDVALLVKFVSFSRLLKEFADVSPRALEVPSFTDEVGISGSLEYAASEGLTSNVTNVVASDVAVASALGAKNWLVAESGYTNFALQSTFIIPKFIGYPQRPMSADLLGPGTFPIYQLSGR